MMGLMVLVDKRWFKVSNIEVSGRVFGIPQVPAGQDRAERFLGYADDLKANPWASSFCG